MLLHSVIINSLHSGDIFFTIYLYLWKVDTYEAKNQELMAENADLRALLRSMQVGSWSLFAEISTCGQVYECNMHFLGSAWCDFWSSINLCYHSVSPYALIDLPPTFQIFNTIFIVWNFMLWDRFWTWSSKYKNFEVTWELTISVMQSSNWWNIIFN